MKRALVVNCSTPHYNLGACKLSHWLSEHGYHTTSMEGDPGLFGYDHKLVCLSVIFSWHAPLARDIALRVKHHAEVWCGGPAMRALAGWWQRETGLSVCLGLDWRFERQRGHYTMTFASRGCPTGCWFCVVPLIEGRTFTLDWDFVPSPVLCDNNLSALPVDFQTHIISRYQDSGVALLDANSGFEPRYFDGGTYERWQPVLRGPWRLAFDELEEADAVSNMLGILREVPARRKQVYVLIGNEPMGSCYERCRKVIEWGGEPYCQPFMPLNTLERRPSVRHDWS